LESDGRSECFSNRPVGNKPPQAPTRLDDPRPEQTLPETSDQTSSQRFYEWMKVGSRRSATAIVPFLVELLEPRSVVDVGCGTGSWLRVFREHGVDDVLGLDGNVIDSSLLEIGSDEFRVVDLREEIH
jgi:SAM-dependent methyltransferase